MGFQRNPENIGKEYEKPISVKINHIERQWLEALKRYYHTKNDSTALKMAAFDPFLKQEELDRFLKNNKVKVIPRL